MRKAKSLLSLVWIFALSCTPLAYADRQVAKPSEQSDQALLRNNPFSRPVKLEPKRNDPRGEFEQTATQMTLTGTLVGDASFANIGGKIFTLGDEVNGQTLIEVHDRHVVLASDNRRVELWVNGDNQRD